MIPATVEEERVVYRLVTYPPPGSPPRKEWTTVYHVAVGTRRLTTTPSYTLALGFTQGWNRALSELTKGGEA